MLGSIFQSKFYQFEGYLQNWSLGSKTLFELFNSTRTKVGFIFAGILLFITYLIELYRPWQQDLRLLLVQYS